MSTSYISSAIECTSADAAVSGLWLQKIPSAEFNLVCQKLESCHLPCVYNLSDRLTETVNTTSALSPTKGDTTYIPVHDLPEWGLSP